MSIDSQTSTPQPTATQLVNPTIYHMQQVQPLRFKQSHPMAVDPSQMVKGPHLYFSQQHSSPQLANADYMDLNTAVSVIHTRGPNMHAVTAQPAPMLRHISDQGYSYGTNTNTIDPVPCQPLVKRLSAGPDHKQRYYYGNMMYCDPKYKDFVGSAPANIEYNHLHHFTDSQIRHPPATPTASEATPSVKSEMMESFEDDLVIQANLQATMEKRRRRRESHNAVERRRRDNINERIHELGTLLPEAASAEEGGPLRLNKGTILRKSVEQIKQLQSEARDYQERIRQLETTLHQLRNINTQPV